MAYDPDDLGDDDTENSGGDPNESTALKGLRKKARQYDAMVKERDEAVARAVKSERRQLISDAGLGDLTPRQQKAILADFEEGAEITPDAIRQAAVDFGWAEAAEPPEQEADTRTSEAGHDRASAAVTGAGAGRSGTITAADVGAWSTEKQVRFMRSQPDAWEQLKQGLDVTGITFT